MPWACCLLCALRRGRKVECIGLGPPAAPSKERAGFRWSSARGCSSLRPPTPITYRSSRMLSVAADPRAMKAATEGSASYTLPENAGFTVRNTVGFPPFRSCLRVSIRREARAETGGGEGNGGGAFSITPWLRVRLEVLEILGARVALRSSSSWSRLVVGERRS